MPPKARVPAAQRQATYRLNHLEQELARGRTHAARRRAQSKSSPTLDAVAKIQANQYAAGYRATNRSRLAQKEMLRRCRDDTLANPASSQATVVAHASSQAQLTSVLPAVGYEAISPLLGDADPTEAELSAVRTRLNLHSVPHPDSPLLYAVGGICGRLFENKRDAAAAASRRGMFAPTIVFHNHHDKLLDFTFWGAGEGSV
ncbi:hypothetical protein FB45DRAFT_1034708 [Roridomyces roridus]|uniref:Uncharacterized protein n=1 Tax=Roridomyces roridus TaxID=1738132 RepID=A0AAD7FDK5_9AGAR|nr:hypothetical protein FB45DRAFT_1034708 [Roridomyces roridus]